MSVIPRLAEWAGAFAAIRQDLHAHPELGFEEHRTSAIVAEKLESWGIEVHRAIARTGVVGVLRGRGASNRAIGLRADMDALAMQEADTLAYRSTVPGKMHGCGHDGHTTMLLAAARYLAETRNFAGTVHFIFQPAEEGGGGARVMLEEGLFDRFPCDSVYAAHTDPLLPLGVITAVAGPVMASADHFDIRIHGKGGHAARPHHAIDPVLVGSHIVVALQSIVSRRTNSFDSAVVGVSTFNAGSAMNVIPEKALLTGTVRTLRAETQHEIQRLLTHMVMTTAEAHGAAADVDYHRGYPPVVNSVHEADCAARAAASVVGADKVLTYHSPSMGGEDFSYMLLQRPGCYVKLGQAADARSAIALHNQSFDFNDSLTPIGASYFARLVEQELPL
ncbi:MAG TPA: M20 aminoacylase family protein [Beijerinckiaceae bacterium]|nr:M20 aminoacylase family protein [Beijerinckiaceae bacterium]